jgi:hypothetical protein
MYVAGPPSRDADAGLPPDSWESRQSRPGETQTRLSGPGTYINRQAVNAMEKIANGNIHPALKFPIGSLEWQRAADVEFLKENPGWTRESLQVFPDNSVTVNGLKYWPPTQTASLFNPDPPMGPGTSAVPNGPYPNGPCHLCGYQYCDCL